MPNKFVWNKGIRWGRGKGFSEQQWLAAGFSTVAIWLGISSWASYHNTTEFIDTTQKLLHSYEVTRTLATISSEMTIAESSRRGYVFVGNREELDRYQESVARLVSSLHSLEGQLGRNPTQLEYFNQIKQLIPQRLALLERSIQRYRVTNQVDLEQRQITTESLRLRDRIQWLLAEMRIAEETLLRQELQHSQNLMQRRMILEIWLTFSMFLVLLLGFLAVYRQVMKRKQLEAMEEKWAQQQELSELKLKFFSMVSHEFRTPLSVVLGSSQLLSENHSQWSAEKRSQSLQRIYSSAQVMKRLLTDILMFSRAEAGNLEFEPEWIELDSFCLNLVEDMRMADPMQDSIQLISHFQGQRVHIDEKLVYSILSNLLLNSVKYSAANQDVVLIVEVDRADLLFYVKDHGMGIPAEDLPHLYEPFYRGRNVSTIAGTGLGLAVVKKCVDLHRGTITVESQEGAGTVFTIRLPAAIAEAGP
ncbi:ATP-binding protein [Alkalinema sp. FACHB-956]|uniref:sensor histidine kinase n=1 Tax=Alkalinema sp. FACHB-956 TaxID=2692768 RepID=UPI0016856955|nr:ATP-binding protein [Alkalinema sp. FACHB-956]MBD2329055.1 CHASE3 domain-containing protein [Alkalinema sp. FACHB-956]